ncbi:hypothetical protein NC652_001975 [Populus alba x Populus x berolinensis]|nr:hypothetical protein NC652_001975 [Populus alba x Populus x berolinensis]
MASIYANLPSPPLLVHGKRIPFRTLQKLPLSAIKERQNCVAVAVKATGESSESSASLSIVKSVQNIWDDSEDRLALVGLGFAALVAVWASANVITAVDKLPVVPSALEFVGILYSSVMVCISISFAQTQSPGVFLLSIFIWWPKSFLCIEFNHCLLPSCMSSSLCFQPFRPPALTLQCKSRTLNIVLDNDQ